MASLSDEAPNSLLAVSDSELVNQAYLARQASRRYTHEAVDLEAEIERRIRANGGTGLPVKGYEVRLTEHQVHYDALALIRLLELEGFDLDACYAREHEETIPAQTVTVPAKWNAQQALKAARKHGRKAQEIVADARTIGYYSVEIEAKEGVLP